MTTRYLSGAYPGGYTLDANYTGLVIESTASVGGAGVVAMSDVSISNDGSVRASGDSYGILLHAGGIVTNGSATDTTALISGKGGLRTGRLATVVNYGVIAGYGRRGDGVDLFHGGLVTNGSSDDGAALIAGYHGVSLQTLPGTVVNFGTIQGADTEAGHGEYGAGVVMYRGGLLTNGSSDDRTAFITGYHAVSVQIVPATVVNYGTIQSLYDRGGVYLKAGGTVINGSNSDTTALIGNASQVFSGVESRSISATVTNFGTIDGVDLYAGTVINGSTADTAALLTGVGVSEATSVSNFGTITYISDVATVTNGSVDDTAALISYGVDGNVGAIANFGTIGSAQNRAAVYLEGGVLINGSSADTTATVSGVYGVLADTRPATVTNFGTIVGTGGKAVQFDAADCVLNVEAGCDFVGRVWGGGGTLDLASGVGTVSGFTGGDVVVRGSMARTPFTYFATLEIASGAQFTLAGHAAIENGGVQTLIDDGMFIVSVDLTVSGTVAGTGTLAMRAGATIEIDTAAPSSLTVAFKGDDATLALRNPLSFAATIGGLAVTDTIDLLEIQATSAHVNSKDVLVIDDGSSTVADLQLKGDYKSATFDLSSDGGGGTNVTLLTLDGAPGQALASPNLLIAAAAQLGASAGSSYATQAVAHALWRPTLLAPRVQLL